MNWMSLNASVTASYFVRFQIAETQKNDPSGSGSPSDPGDFRNRASTFLLTSLVVSLTKSRSALYCPGWMFCAAVLAAKPESLEAWKKKHESPLQTSDSFKKVSHHCFRMFQVSYGFHTSFLHVSHCRESPTFLILTCEQSGPSRFCARLGVPSHGHNNGSTKRSASLAKLSDNYSDCVDSPASYAGATSHSLDLHWIFKYCMPSAEALVTQPMSVEPFTFTLTRTSSAGFFLSHSRTSKVCWNVLKRDHIRREVLKRS